MPKKLAKKLRARRLERKADDGTSAAAPPSAQATEPPPPSGVDQAGVQLNAQQFYSHGGFMASIGAMLDDARWNAILAELSPEVHAAAAEALAKDAVGKAMTAAENDPVVAAYGSLRSAAQQGADHAVVALEWDVWLDDEDPLTFERVRIAHGTTVETAGHAILKASMPVGLRKNAPTLTDWLQVFCAALQAGGADGVTTVQDAVRYMNGEGQAGLVLDVKSRYTTGEELAQFVAWLEEELGILVRGVGSFTEAQLVHIPPERAVRFFHRVDDLEGSAEQLDPNTAVMFNLGCLVKKSKREGWSLKEKQVHELRLVAGVQDLRVGGYVQESALSPGAYDVLAAFVVANPSLFSLGFAYGNVDGRVALGVKGDGLGGQKPLGNQPAKERAGVVGVQRGRWLTRYGLAVAILNAPARRVTAVISKSLERQVFTSLEGWESESTDPLRLAHPVTRAEAATMIARSHGLSLAIEEIRLTYLDLDPDHWAASYVYALTKLGVVQGFEDGLFRPDQPIEAERSAKLLARVRSPPGHDKRPFAFDPVVTPRPGELKGFLARLRRGPTPR